MNDYSVLFIGGPYHEKLKAVYNLSYFVEIMESPSTFFNYNYNEWDKLYDCNKYSYRLVNLYYSEYDYYINKNVEYKIYLYVLDSYYQRFVDEANQSNQGFIKYLFRSGTYYEIKEISSYEEWIQNEYLPTPDFINDFVINKDKEVCRKKKNNKIKLDKNLFIM